MKGTVLRNKIIFLLIFVFSFIIVHDTVLDVMQGDQEIAVSHDSVNIVSGEEYQSLHHLHNMFHFVALIEAEDPVAESTKREAFIVTALLQYFSSHREQDDRPPIA